MSDEKKPTPKRQVKPGQRLTGTELNILRVLMNGGLISEAAELIGRSPDTIKSHLNRITVKLGSKDTKHSIALAMRLGLLRAENVKPGTVDLHTLHVNNLNSNRVLNGTASEVGYEAGRITPALIALNDDVQVSLGGWYLEHTVQYVGTRGVSTLQGWVIDSKGSFSTLKNAIMTYAYLPHQACPYGHKVAIDVTMKTRNTWHGEEKFPYMTITWAHTGIPA